MDYKIAVCDDNDADTAYLAELCENWAGQREHGARIKKFPSAEAFLFCYEEEKDFDILLLDIEMSGMDGVALAEKVRGENREIPIIFITGYPDYMARGYDVAALHYLMKPIEKEKLFEVLDRAAAMVGRKRKALLLSQGRENLLLYPEEILYAEAQAHYVILHTMGETHKIRMTMQETLEKLGDDFFGCHRSFIVGLRHIRRITKKTVELANGEELPLGRGLYDNVNLALIRFLKK